MRLIQNHAALIAACLLGVAMGSLVFGFALFFMTPEVAVSTPQTWGFAALTAVASFIAAHPSSQHKNAQRT